KHDTRRRASRRSGGYNRGYHGTPTGVAQTAEESTSDSGTAEPGVGIGSGVVWVQTAGTGPHGAGAAAAGTAGTGGGPDGRHPARNVGGNRRAAERVAHHTAAGGQARRWGAAHGGRELGDGVSRGAPAVLPRALRRTGSAGRGFCRGRTAGVPTGPAGHRP